MPRRKYSGSLKIARARLWQDFQDTHLPHRDKTARIGSGWSACRQFHAVKGARSRWYGHNKGRSHGRKSGAEAADSAEKEAKQCWNPSQSSRRLYACLGLDVDRRAVAAPPQWSASHAISQRLPCGPPNLECNDRPIASDDRALRLDRRAEIPVIRHRLTTENAESTDGLHRVRDESSWMPVIQSPNECEPSRKKANDQKTEILLSGILERVGFFRWHEEDKTWPHGNVERC